MLLHVFIQRCITYTLTQNTVSLQVQHATLPGTSLTVTSTSEAVHITLAYAAAAALMDAYLEWKVCILLTLAVQRTSNSLKPDTEDTSAHC